MQAHGFSLLIKNLLEELQSVGTTVETTIKISNFEGNHAWFRKLLHECQKEVYGHNLEIVAQVTMDASAVLFTIHAAC